MTTPSHYQTCGALGRPILLALGVPAELLDGKCDDMIMAQHSARNFWELNAYKYLWRAGEKDAAPEDLTKALDCFTRLSPQLGGTVPPDEVLDMIRWLVQEPPNAAEPPKDEMFWIKFGSSGSIPTR